MSSASAPVILPQEHPVGPVAAPPPVRHPRHSRMRWLVLGCVVLLTAIGLYLKLRPAPAASGPPRSEAAVTRTATVTGGRLERTIRLTGTTAAENFVSLITPQLRGSRGFQGGMGQSTRRASTSTMTTTQVTSTADSGGSSSSSSRSSSSSSAAASALSSGDLSVGSTMNAGGTGPSASQFQAATTRGGSSRIGGERGGGGSRGGGSSSSSAGMAFGDLGSTAGTLPGSGGGGPPGGGGGGMGGGGGNDFTLVLQHLIKPGSLVKKGDIVAEFDRQYMLLRLDDYRAGVLQQQLDMKNLLAQLDVTRRNYEQNILGAKGGLEKADLDLKTTPVRSAIQSEQLKLAREEAEARYKQIQQELQYREVSDSAQIHNEELDFKLAEIELKRAEANAERMVSRATIDGLTVMQTTRRGTEFGQIQQGDQLMSGQLFMQIVDLRSMVVNATVNQTDVEGLRIGARARVHFDAYPDLELPARLHAIGAMTKPGGMRASFMREVPVRLKLEKLDPRVIPDLSVSVDVVVETDERAAAVVPLGSVFRDAASKPFVFLQTPAGFETRPIELGLTNHVAAVVRSGLAPGEAVAAEWPVVRKNESAKEQ